MKLGSKKKYGVVIQNSIIAGAVVVSFVAFHSLTITFARLSAPYVVNCSDVSYVPCSLHIKLYGLPFTYALGYPFIPGGYGVKDTNWLLLLVDYLVVVGVPVGVVLLVRKRRR